MMGQSFESRIGQVPFSSKQVYDFLSDFNNFKDIIPAEQVSNWQAESDSCRFDVQSIGHVGLHITEKKPNELIKINGDNNATIPFFFWIQIKEIKQADSRIKLTIRAKLNPVIRMMAGKVLQQFLNILVDHIEKFDFGKEEGL